jgi:hypothetical protein
MPQVCPRITETSTTRAADLQPVGLSCFFHYPDVRIVWDQSSLIGKWKTRFYRSRCTSDRSSVPVTVGEEDSALERKEQGLLGLHWAQLTRVTRDSEDYIDEYKFLFRIADHMDWVEPLVSTAFETPTSPRRSTKARYSLSFEGSTSTLSNSQVISNGRFSF